MVIEQRPGPWAWRDLLPDDELDALEYHRRALDAGYSPTIAAGFLGWCTITMSGAESGLTDATTARYRRMLVELAPSEKLGQAAFSGTAA